MKGKNGEQDGIKIFLSTRDDGNMAFYAGEERGRSFENRECFFQERGLDLSRAVFLQQTHSDHILVVGKENAGRGVSSHEDALSDADALVTDVPGITLCVQVADCAPILLFDPVRRVIAAVHSGWRGTLQNIVGKTVLKMADTFGSEAKDIQVWIGPAIEGSCFVVDDRIADPVKANGFLGLSDDETHWDISVACRGQLVREGVREENIDMSGECTVCNKEQYFSYKREGDHAGRMLGGIVLI